MSPEERRDGRVYRTRRDLAGASGNSDLMTRPHVLPTCIKCQVAMPAVRGDVQLARSLSGRWRRRASPASVRSVSRSRACGDRSEGALELRDLKRANQRRRDAGCHVRRKAVHAPALDRGDAVTQARQRKHLVSHATDHVLRLPHPSPRDARAGMEGVEPGQADQLRPRRLSYGGGRPSWWSRTASAAGESPPTGPTHMGPSSASANSSRPLQRSTTTSSPPPAD
jgi:hypothetical protein